MDKTFAIGLIDGKFKVLHNELIKEVSTILIPENFHRDSPDVICKNIDLFYYYALILPRSLYNPSIINKNGGQDLKVFFDKRLKKNNVSISDHPNNPDGTLNKDVIMTNSVISRDQLQVSSYNFYLKPEVSDIMLSHDYSKYFKYYNGKVCDYVDTSGTVKKCLIKDCKINHSKDMILVVDLPVTPASLPFPIYKHQLK